MQAGWKLSKWKVENFLYELELRYCKDNPYHNNTHAADVVQASYAIWNASRLPQLSKLELFSLIIASAVHDVEHPGVNNDFMINTRSTLALVYNDRSVNENSHVSLAFHIALKEENNIFDGLDPEEFRKVGLSPRNGGKTPF